ncbi:c-type cytochrome biogenesis protein CcmI [Pseudooceanicola sp.]|uniref:c-type cytochrome biogenesis protein CcmI n=1 Tax=Pseudooceanicola sp. TaxID=1914328 RepID=UPI0035C6A05A
MLDWIIPAAMSLAVAAVIGLAVLRARDTGSDGEDAEQDLGIYRRQMDEVERDQARGVIPGEEAERLRAEIARRLIEADSRSDAAATTHEPARMRPALVAVILVVLIALPLTVYANLGAPGYPDMGLRDRLSAAQERLENRPAQAEAEAAVPAGAMAPQDTPPADFEVLIKRLREAVAERPDDLQGQELLARNEAALGNFRAGYEAQEKVLSIKGDAATADDYMAYADMLILAAGGYVSPQAEVALRAALARDPHHAPTLYYMGLMMRQNGRPDLAFRTWDRLLRNGPEDAPWIPPIRAQIDEVAALAGVRYEQPQPSETLAGPTAEDMANAGDLSDEDRQEMIQGMVSRLSDRLATQGGSAAEWARLIRAFGVLGDIPRARAVAAEARQVFAEAPQALAEIEAAAATLPPAAPAPEPGPRATSQDADGGATDGEVPAQGRDRATGGGDGE